MSNVLSKLSKEKFYKGIVYEIVNNVNNIKYIGQTIQSLNKRFSIHKYDSKRYTSYFNEQLLKIGTDNFFIKQIKIFYNEDKKLLQDILKNEEKNYIDYCINNNIELYNIFENKNNYNKYKNLNNSSSIKVTQLDLNNNIIKIWNSSREVERIFNKKYMQPNINHCCRNKIKTAYGFKWRYYRDGDENLIQNNI